MKGDICKCLTNNAKTFMSIKGCGGSKLLGRIIDVKSSSDNDFVLRTKAIDMKSAEYQWEPSPCSFPISGENIGKKMEPH